RELGERLAHVRRPERRLRLDRRQRRHDTDPGGPSRRYRGNRAGQCHHVQPPGDDRHRPGHRQLPALQHAARQVAHRQPRRDRAHHAFGGRAMLNRHPRSRAGVAGFTLIEVLVALIVLSIGLLGLAALQIQSIKHNTDAYFRTQATLLAYDIIDRMRANSAAVSAGIYEVSAPPATEVTCGEDAAGCGSAAELAAYDLT